MSTCPGGNFRRLDLENKIYTIRDHLAPIMGAKLVSYETAELQLTDGTWEAWPDLPIRLATDLGRVVAIAWSKFDDLWLASDLSLPFSFEGTAIRWVENSIERINPLLGGTLRSAMLGRGEMSWGGESLEIWTRLLIRVDDRWLEIYNALDENGYDLHDRMPAGEFRPCV